MQDDLARISDHVASPVFYPYEFPRCIFDPIFSGKRRDTLRSFCHGRFSADSLCILRMQQIQKRNLISSQMRCVISESPDIFGDEMDLIRLLRVNSEKHRRTVFYDYVGV